MQERVYKEEPGAADHIPMLQWCSLTHGEPRPVNGCLPGLYK